MPLGTRRDRPAYASDRLQPATHRVHHSHPQAPEAPASPARDRVRRGVAGDRDRKPAIRPDADHHRPAPPHRPLAGPAGPAPVAGDARDGPAAATLAAPPVRRHSALLLSGRSRGNGHLADRSRPDPGTGGPPLPRPSRGGERAGQSRTPPAGAQTRDRRRQDDRHGHAHRVADGQRGAPSRQPEVHARVPGRHPGVDDPRPAARAPTARPRQLLRQPRTRAARPARRSGPRQDRHHQLPRLPAARDAGDFQNGPRAAARAWAGTAHGGNRGADAPARPARTPGHDAHSGAQRRSPPLLP